MLRFSTHLIAFALGVFALGVLQASVIPAPQQEPACEQASEPRLDELGVCVEDHELRIAALESALADLGVDISTLNLRLDDVEKFDSTHVHDVAIDGSTVSTSTGK